MLNLQAQRAATESYLRLIDAVEECERLYDEARIPKPDLLLKLNADVLRRNHRFIGTSSAVRSFKPLSPPEMPARPTGAAEDWLCIPAKEASATSLLFAYMRSKGKGVSTDDLLSFLRDNGAISSAGGGYNILTRLVRVGKLTKKGDTYTIDDITLGGIIEGGNLWNSKFNFDTGELAWFRRAQVLRALKEYGPLQIFEIAKILKSADWMPSAVNKDSIKLDMQSLTGEGLIRKDDQTKRWELTRKELLAK
jgi:hypothetical protein